MVDDTGQTDKKAISLLKKKIDFLDVGSVFLSICILLVTFSRFTGQLFADWQVDELFGLLIISILIIGVSTGTIGLVKEGANKNNKWKFVIAAMIVSVFLVGWVFYTYIMIDIEPATM
ncbi:MAG: hypothetical protein WC437_01720 [Patescibacteria group bacterium]|jgi:cytochrome bd-type quinol oxidase subunit 2|nr:hypothetical protein [Patescibacteria group bacterium]